MKVCTLDECEQKHYALGLCRRHYSLKRYHGDPLASVTPKASVGEPRKFYEETVLTYDGEECLIWPYARLDRGYAMMTTPGRSNRVSKILCEDVNGPPPTPEHQAAHACGKGHLGCVAKKHLSWKTPADNQADRLIHGTSTRGENNGFSKLTNITAQQIFALKGSMGQRKIAKKFGVSRTAVGQIHRGTTWAWLTIGME